MTRSFFPMLISNLLSVMTALIGIFNLFTLREALMMIVTSSPIGSWWWRVIDIAFLIICGVIWLVVVFLSQSSYREAYMQKSLSRLVCKVTGYQAVLFFAASTIVHFYDFEPATVQGITITAVQALLAAAMLFYAYKASFMKCVNL